MNKNAINEAIQRILDARHHDPFEILGRHEEAGTCVIRVYKPRISYLKLLQSGAEFVRKVGTDLFELRLSEEEAPLGRYQLEWKNEQGEIENGFDPYSFTPQIPDYDLHLFGEGKHWHIHRFLGANPWVADGVEGVLFATWAPNAARISVVGDFNQWDGRVHPMRNRGTGGVWELFIPGVKAGSHYKFEIVSKHSNALFLKSDPYAKQFELRPGAAAIINKKSVYEWKDQEWLSSRSDSSWLHQPMSIYEVHLGSWKRDHQNNFLNYHEIAEQLIPYVKELGFTHIELLPITEFPYDASWGYQALGYFAPTSRFGSPDAFRYFVDRCHQQGIGVILDWVPAHFPSDAHGLARFDGSALYEHEDPRRGHHRDWGTYIYNYGRNEVKNFLLASALFWLEEYHIDGLRVDAVASMLYLDYSREEGDWIPNQYGGNENLEAIEFLRELNTVAHEQYPGATVIAEESTAWPQVSRPTWLGGLGFSMKWNMGWMHDTLDYMSQDPIYRHYHHEKLTFGLLYSFTENFVLPFSHDEVVHGKASMRYKMPGDEWQQFANLRLLYTYMFSYPGKKLLFMGCEFGQGPEWNFDTQLDWYALDYPLHSGLKSLVSDLNKLYRAEKALYHHDFDSKGFEWIDCHDASQSIISFIRHCGEEYVIVILNFTPEVRYNYRIGVPENATYRELLNSDSTFYGGSNQGNGTNIAAEPQAWMGRPCSINLTIPPLAGLVLKPVAKE